MVANTVIDTCTDDNNVKHPINAPVQISSTVTSGRAHGTFDGTVVAAGATGCPPATKPVSGSFSIAVTNQ